MYIIEKKALVVPPVSLHCDRFSAGEEAEVAPHPLTQTKSHDVMLSPFMQGIRGAAESKLSPFSFSEFPVGDVIT